MNLATYVKSKVNLSEVFKLYGDVTGSGKQKFAHCYLHDDKTPSVSIRDDRGAWHCFSCGSKGDIISLVQEMEGLNFTDTLDWIMDNFNIEPPQRIYRDALRAQISQLEKHGNISDAIALLLNT